MLRASSIVNIHAYDTAWEETYIEYMYAVSLNSEGDQVVGLVGRRGIAGVDEDM